MAAVFDTHAHLSKESNLPQHLCLNVTTKSDEWPTVLYQYQTHPNILPALGIHPWNVESVSDSDMSELAKLLVSHDVYAVGEIGLDFSKQFVATKQSQLQLFEHQLFMAKTYQLPVSIHCIKAHSEVINLLSQFDLGRAGVLHGLGASKELISRYLDIGYKIGVNAVLCRSNARRYHEMIEHFDLDHFVLETDYPNVLLPSADKAGLKDIELIANKIGELKKITVGEVIDQTSYNAHQIFLR